MSSYLLSILIVKFLNAAFHFNVFMTTYLQASRVLAILCTDGAVSQRQLRQTAGIALLIDGIAAYAELRSPLVGKKAGLS